MQSMIYGDFIEDLGVVLVAVTAAFVLSWQLALALVAVGPPVAIVMSAQLGLSGVTTVWSTSRPSTATVVAKAW